MAENDQKRISEVTTKHGVDYFIQETYLGPKEYLVMIRRFECILPCEKAALN